MAKKLVSVIITTRDRKEIVSDCLESVLKMDYPNFEVILVDNASTDGTARAVKKKFPKVKVIVSKKNLGLNGGKNLGQKYACGDYILFLDSDTVVDKNLLAELIKIDETDPKIGIICPKIYYFDRKNVIWYAGSHVNLLTSQTKNIGANQADRWQWNQVCPTEFAPTAYLAKRIVAQKLKGHNADFFMTYGDTDFGFRAREAGFKVIFCPTAKLWHRLQMQENIKTIRALGYNLPMRAYYFARNRVVFMKRHAPPVNFLIFMIFFFPIFTFYFAYKIIRFGGGWYFLRPHLKGSMNGLQYALGGEIKNVYS